MKITKLSTSNRFLAKQFNETTDGEIHTKGYDLAKEFSIELIDVDGIVQLSELLSSLEDNPFSCVIRGAPHLDTVLDKHIRRRMYREGEKAQESPFLDVAIPWMLIDIDTLPLPDGYDYIDEPEQVVKYAISQLPQEFHNTYCHWQFSSSAGIKNPNIIKLHLWFWLESPCNSYDLKRWASQVNQLKGTIVDTSVYNAVQIHYTATPIFNGSTKDPLKIRSGLLNGGSDVVAINLDFPELESGDVNITITTNDSPFHTEVKGFEGFLAVMGDDSNGQGFNQPLLRATASIVATKGSNWIEHNKESIISDIQERIDDADQSNHTVEDVSRYKSEAYLESLIQSAIDRGYGDRVKVEPPYFNSEQLTLKEGEDKLKDAVRKFNACIVMANKKRKPEALTAQDKADFSLRKQNLAIKAAAGLGKTSQIISELMAKRVKPNERVNIEYYIPTHNLGSQVEADIKRAFTEKAERIESVTGESTHVNVNTILGRYKDTPDGIAVCRKSEEATALNKLGKSVEFLLCNKGAEKCEFYDDCIYQNQFKASDNKVEELNLPIVNIMAHNHLFHKKRELLTKPEFIVVDESFYQAGIEKIKIPLDKVRGVKNKITRFIYDALLDDEPLLKALREERITPYQLEQEAKAHKPELGISNISPSMSWKEQQKELSSASGEYNRIDRLLNLLADELSITDRDESYIVTMVNDEVVMQRRMEMNVPDDVPMLFIDADLNRNITNLYRPDTEVIKIPVERQAIVHQFNQTWSVSSLEKEGNAILNDTKEFIDLIVSTGSTLIVTSQSVRKLLTEEKPPLPIKGMYRDAAIIHYSNLRGVNDYSNYKNVIVIGREQPPAKAMEALTKGLWWDSNELIKTVPEEKGNHPYLKNLRRSYRMRNHSPEDEKVQLHPDKRVQDLLELARETEITQGIDRLRLVRGSNDRQVFILTSIPVDITVDNLWSWDRLQEFLRLWNESDGVLSLSPTDIRKVLPNIVGSESGAKKLTARLRSTLPLIDILISHEVLHFSYETNTPKRTAQTALVSSKHEDPRKALEEKLGETVTAFSAGKLIIKV